jgi:multicomponent Na+:H+ antiporter subunit B
MSRRARLVLFSIAAVALAVLLLDALRGLSPFGDNASPYGDLLASVAVPERHLTNVVAAVTFDYRGFDTLGEEYVLFAGLVGGLLLLRRERGERRQSPPRESPEGRRRAASEAAHLIGRVMLPITVLFGLDLVVHGPLTPGGGFQGGALLATAPLVVYLVSDYAVFTAITPFQIIDVAEGCAAGAYAVIGLAGGLVGYAFLQNFLPLGAADSVWGSGTIALINAFVGLEVAAAFVLVSHAFLDQIHMLRDRRPR